MRPRGAPSGHAGRWWMLWYGKLLEAAIPTVSVRPPAAGARQTRPVHAHASGVQWFTCKQGKRRPP